MCHLYLCQCNFFSRGCARIVYLVDTSDVLSLSVARVFLAGKHLHTRQVENCLSRYTLLRLVNYAFDLGCVNFGLRFSLSSSSGNYTKVENHVRVIFNVVATGGNDRCDFSRAVFDDRLYLCLVKLLWWVRLCSIKV